MQHARHAEVLHVGELAGDLVGNIDARHRLADHLVVLGVLRLGRLGVVELEGELLAADQLAVADLLAAAADDAVGDRELFLLDAEALGRLVEQRVPRGRRRVADLHAAELDREAAPGRALVGREQRVAGDQVDAGNGTSSSSATICAQRRRDAGAEIDLAGIDGHHALGVDRRKASTSVSASGFAAAAAPCASASPIGAAEARRRPPGRRRP